MALERDRHPGRTVRLQPEAIVTMSADRDVGPEKRPKLPSRWERYRSCADHRAGPQSSTRELK